MYIEFITKNTSQHTSCQISSMNRPSSKTATLIQICISIWIPNYSQLPTKRSALKNARRTQPNHHQDPQFSLCMQFYEYRLHSLHLFKRLARWHSQRWYQPFMNAYLCTGCSILFHNLVQINDSNFIQISIDLEPLFRGAILMKHSIE